MRPKRKQGSAGSCAPLTNVWTRRMVAWYWSCKLRGWTVRRPEKSTNYCRQVRRNALPRTRPGGKFSNAPVRSRCAKGRCLFCENTMPAAQAFRTARGGVSSRKHPLPDKRGLQRSVAQSGPENGAMPCSNVLDCEHRDGTRSIAAHSSHDLSRAATDHRCNAVDGNNKHRLPRKIGLVMMKI